MTIETKTLPALPGGAQVGDGLLTLRPGSATPYALDPTTLQFSIAALEAVMAQLPATAPAASGKAWLNSGVLNFSGQTTTGSGSAPDQADNTPYIVGRDGSFIVGRDGSFLTYR